MASYKPIVSRPSPAGHVNPGVGGKEQTTPYPTDMDGSKQNTHRDVKTSGKGLMQPALAGTKERIRPGPSSPNHI